MWLVLLQEEEETWSRDTEEGSHVMMGASWNGMDDVKEASLRQNTGIASKCQQLEEVRKEDAC